MDVFIVVYIGIFAILIINFCFQRDIKRINSDDSFVDKEQKND